MPKLIPPKLFFCQEHSFVAQKNNLLELAALFAKAVEESRHLNIAVCSKQFIKLYSLYKQATEGDIKKPITLNSYNALEKAKYKAWLALKGKSTKDAQTEYITLVHHLKH